MFDGDAQGIDGKPFLREGLLILGANVALVIGGVVQVVGNIVGNQGRIFGSYNVGIN